MIAYISFVIDSRELKIAQTVQINQLFQLLNLTCTYSDVFSELRCMLVSKNVNNDVSRIRLLLGYTNMANVTSSVITFLTLTAQQGRT